MLYQERYSSAYLSQAQSSLVQWGLDGKLRTILDTIISFRSCVKVLLYTLINRPMVSGSVTSIIY